MRERINIESRIITTKTCARMVLFFASLYFLSGCIAVQHVSKYVNSEDHYTRVDPKTLIINSEGGIAVKCREIVSVETSSGKRRVIINRYIIASPSVLLAKFSSSHKFQVTIGKNRIEGFDFFLEPEDFTQKGWRLYPETIDTENSKAIGKSFEGTTSQFFGFDRDVAVVYRFEDIDRLIVFRSFGMDEPEIQRSPFYRSFLRLLYIPAVIIDVVTYPFLLIYGFVFYF